MTPSAAWALPLSPVEFHVLLVLASEDLYGYAIQKAIAEESGGVVSPEIGSLYRVLARLMSAGLVSESTRQESGGPGRPRKYYGITAMGREALGGESVRLERALALYRERVAPAEGGQS